MREIFADLHVHIGRSESGKPIKITAFLMKSFVRRTKSIFNINVALYKRKIIP